MRTAAGLLLLAIAALLVALCCPDLARAATCDCARTRVCVCPAGQCECPDCPGNAMKSRPIVVQHQAAPAAPAVVTVQYPVAAVYAVPVYSMPAAAPRVSTGCYQDAYGNWICPQQQSGYVFRRKDFTAGERRRMRRAQRDGWIFFE